MTPAITLHEPWATLMFIANPYERKKIETRNWRPVINGEEYRGPLVIHAGKQLDAAICRTEPYASVLRKHFGTWAFLDMFKLGCILGSTELLHVERTEVLRALPNFNPFELAFGNYDPNRYGWITDYAIALPRPIPARGMQKLWRITDDQRDEVMRQTPQAGLA